MNKMVFWVCEKLNSQENSNEYSMMREGRESRGKCINFNILLYILNS